MDLVERFRSGDRRALARLITLVENGDPDSVRALAELHKNFGTAYILGITGPPGAGKSTLVDCLITSHRAEGRTVGIVCVDPSSPFSGGAILGDRIRMQRHALDEGVYIRSLGTRGSHGGLSRGTRKAVQLMDAFGFDLVMIETVGVGQTELDVMDIADTTVVILGPESGDTVQTMKAGLMEIADVFAVNKADRDGAEKIAADVRAAIGLNEAGDPWRPPVILCQANASKGIDDLRNAIARHRAYLEEHDLRESRRKAIRVRELTELLIGHFRAKIEDSRANGDLAEYFSQVESGEIAPFEAVERIISSGKLK